MDGLHAVGLRLSDAKDSRRGALLEDMEWSSPKLVGRACEFPEYSFKVDQPFRATFGLVLSSDEFAGLDEKFLSANSSRCVHQEAVTMWVV